jgi:hypothetical protein
MSNVHPVGLKIWMWDEPPAALPMFLASSSTFVRISPTNLHTNTLAGASSRILSPHCLPTPVQKTYITVMPYNCVSTTTLLYTKLEWNMSNHNIKVTVLPTTSVECPSALFDSHIQNCSYIWGCILWWRHVHHDLGTPQSGPLSCRHSLLVVHILHHDRKKTFFVADKGSTVDLRHY